MRPHHTNECAEARRLPSGRAGWSTSVRLRGAVALSAVFGLFGPVSAGPAAAAQTSATTDPPPMLGWPNASNTGVPDGTELGLYDGPTTITVDGTVIDAMIVNSNLRVMANDVRITRSIVNGGIRVREPGDGSLTISDSEIRIPTSLGTGLDRHNFRAVRVEVTGGRRSVYCFSNCVVEDSWVHGQAYDPDGVAHMSGIRMGQNTTVRNNTITCDGGRTPPAAGCSAGLTGYGDFAAVRDNTIQGNLFLGGTSTMCAYGGSSDGKPFGAEARNIRFIDNVFVRGNSGACGNQRAIAGFDSDAPGNVWQNNRWDDGTILLP